MVARLFLARSRDRFPCYTILNLYPYKMKIAFRDIRLSPDNKAKLARVNSIISEYRGQGLVLTLRQLYYQLVSRDVIPNNVKEYKKLGNLLREGRMSGVVDWSAIEDRLRKPKTPNQWK